MEGGKGSGVWPSMVTHVWNLCFAFNPSKCTHTAVNIHLEQWAAGGSVPCSRVSPQSWYVQYCHGYSLPPTYNPCRTWDSNPRPSGYKSNSLSIRPRLPPRRTDDTQIYIALSPNDYSPIDSFCQCIDEINSWMCQNFLQLNKEKTEVIAFGNKKWSSQGECIPWL